MSLHTETCCHLPLPSNEGCRPPSMDFGRCDLGFAIARRATNNSIGRTDTSTSLLTSSQQAITAPHGHGAGASSSKQQHGASPDYRKREEGRGGDYSAGHKRARPGSPPPARGPDRDRESRWDGPPSRRRFSPPPPATWEREERGGGGGGPA
jgi:cleavage stimulation factor subunit 3